MAGVAGSAYYGTEAIHYQQAVIAERAAAETANAEILRLRDELGGVRQALNGAQERLGEVKDEARHRIAASEQAASTSADQITEMTRRLEQVQHALRLAEAQRATLMARLSRSEMVAAQDQTRQQEGMRAEQEQLEKKLKQLAADREKLATERDKAESERNRLRNRVGELEQKLSLQLTRQPPRPVASAHPAPALPPRPTREAEPRVASLPPSPPTLAAPVAAAPSPGTAAASPAPVAPTHTATAAIALAPPPPPPAAYTATIPQAQPPAASATPQADNAAAPAPVAPTHTATAAIALASPPPPPPPAAYTAPAPQAQPPVAATAVPAVARNGIAQFERVLASAGIDVKNLYSQYGVNRGLGGPYIPNPRGTQPETLSTEKLVALSRMVKSLPVAAPLHSYEIGSRFGVRGDPIHGRAALHTGTDFRAPYMSPVYATAAGVVTFSGYRADYGKIVEIDHGNGLVTRYGHLNRTTVSVGQRVAAQTQIGFLGSTGRATGPHVHYEVVVNGEPQDPEKFMALGRILPVLAQR